MGRKIKVAGYAQKISYGNGIEYRNFSDDLVGNQFTSNGGNSLFTIGNFEITTNLDSKISKIFNTNNFSGFLTLSDLKNDDNVILKIDNSKVTLNLNKSRLSNYAYFGSLREYIRVSLENIIINWPASLLVTPLNNNNPLVNENTVEDYVYDNVNGVSSFKINVNRLENKFNINFLKNGTIIDSFSEGNDLRNIVINYGGYVININDKSYKIIDFVGADSNANDYIYLKVEGDVFNSISNFKIRYHIRPNDLNIENFFFGLNDFENNILNRLSNPIYTSSYDYNYETENGSIILGKKIITWPVSDGYNIDFQSESYVEFVTQLLEISDASDLIKTNLVNRFFVSESISEFDTLPNYNVDDFTSGQKMNSTLKIYGREFDEVKKFIDGIAFANVVTYDKNGNIPDSLIKNLAKVLGWDLISSILEVDLLKNYLTLDENTYDGHSRGMTAVEKEVELYRRLILNTPWLWKSKGTRKSIEFLFKFIGTPDGLISFNEYIYVANNSLDIDLFKDILTSNTGDDDLIGLNIDTEGFPVVNRNNSEMYFQKAGLWYRETSGVNSNIDILVGNNPHVGPYDAGQEYMNQFNCLIPDFEPVTLINEKIRVNTDNLFTNYDEGTFDDIYNNNIVGTIDLNIDFSGMVNTQMVEDLLGYQIQPDLSGCSGTTTWVMNGYLDNELIYSNPLVSGDSLSNGVLINYGNLEGSFIDSLSGMLNTLNVYYSPITSITSTTEFNFVEGSGLCEVYEPYYLNKDIRVELNLNLDYSCLGGDCSPSSLHVSDINTETGFVSFSNVTNNVVMSADCCTNLGFNSVPVNGGFNCYNTGTTSSFGLTTDLYVFLDSNLGTKVIPYAKSIMNAWFSQYLTDNPSHTGNIYLMESFDGLNWLDYMMQPWYGNFEINEPTPPPYLNDDFYTIVFTTSSLNTYHYNTTNMVGQPTVNYTSNYDALVNYHPNFTNFKGLIFPVSYQFGSVDIEEAVTKQALASIEGRLIPNNELPSSNVNLSELTTNNPYITPSLVALKEFNIHGVYDKIGIEPTSMFYSQAFIDELNNFINN